RASAVTTLVAIGPDVSVSVRSTLKSKSGSARAAATEVLARLQLLDLAECQTLLKDADPRVRAAVARSLSKLGKPAVTVLAEMLADPESAVGAQAIRALQINHADPQVAIGGLTRVLQRSEIRDSAGTALGSYGTLAQRAIPTIISAVPSERPIFFYYHTDGAALALRHIGPPHPDDVPQICQTLKQGPYPASFIAAESLLTLGPEGKAVADDLAATAIRWAEEYRLAKARIPQEMQNDFTGNESVSILWGAERCATAFWHVTHDDRRFFELLEVLIKKAGDPLFI
ncbi:MAG: HEAT repeat domain-containing protein, partial [Planctomycetota bacterium]